MNKSKTFLLALILVLLGCVYYFDIGQFLNLAYLKQQQNLISDYVQQHHLVSVLAYFCVYVLVTALSIPGAALMTLLGGALFGLVEGVLIISFASSCGATLAMLVARWLLRDSVQQRFQKQLITINAGIEKEGAFYLFTLRLIPIVPFFVINLVMGLTKMPALRFYWVSQLGMLAGTAVYVNAGTQLASIDSLKGIISAEVFASFVLLGVFPLFAKRLIAFLKSRQVYRGFKKPQQFDEDIVVIGAGSGGLVTAYIAAILKSKVSLIEQHRMGGDCLNTGCVPSKALIRSAQFKADIDRAEILGFSHAHAEFSFNHIMARVQRIIKTIEPHDSIERYSQLGVNVVQGRATITSPYTVEVNGQSISTRNIVIASGAKPFIPNIKGIEAIGYWSSDTIWQLEELPKRLLVLGGGPIGCELSQAFARLGSQVTQIVKHSRLMVKEDQDVSDLVLERFQTEGITVLLNHHSLEFIIEADEKILCCEIDNRTVKIPFDEVLIAVGRSANTTGFGLENLNIETDSAGNLLVNQYLQTQYPNIYAVGDVLGHYQFTHVSSHQAWYAAVNALFGRFKKFAVDYRVIPWATFVEPEVARVGLNEQEANAQGIAVEVTRFDIGDLDRAITNDQAQGFIKVLTPPGKDTILGVTIVGEQAGELIAEYVLAMKHNIGLNKILGTIHIYPTLAEMNKSVAGVWKNARKPQGLLRWLERFFNWQRRQKPHTPRNYGSLASNNAVDKNS